MTFWTRRRLEARLPEPETRQKQPEMDPTPAARTGNDVPVVKVQWSLSFSAVFGQVSLRRREASPNVAGTADA